jgi:CheY-like chemotaxis protein
VRALSALIRPPLALTVWRVNVLVVDDDAADTRLIVKALKRNPDVGEVVSRSLPGRALLELTAGRLRPDLVLLDLSMPKLDGFRFLEVLRMIPAMAETPVVIVTTSGLARDVEQAAGCSISGYIVKPDTYDELEKRLDRIIEQTLGGFRRS